MDMEEYSEVFSTMACNVCPWWLGYLLVNPLRKALGHHPEAILAPYLRPGMKALDIGSGMGFFTIPMAKMLGTTGRVYAVDPQPKMISALERRLSKAGVQGHVETRVCSFDSLKIGDLAGVIDFALTFAMVHEVPDKPRLFKEVADALKTGGLLLFAEPKGHVSEEAFAESIKIAEAQGLKRVESPAVNRCISVVLKKM
jgi:ubiquinone/menaquinone biosynthesis C-methylase UbiE